MKKTKKRIFPVLISIIATTLCGFLIWKLIRANFHMEIKDLGLSTAIPYDECEKVSKAVALSYITYGYERSALKGDTVAEMLSENKIYIINENYHIFREDEKDPASAKIDIGSFVKDSIGDFRFIFSMQDNNSSFFGIVTADDENKCLWISYAGAISFKDCLACTGMVMNPKLTTQETQAIQLFETALQTKEVQEEGYHVVLTGHSLGGALAATVSMIYQIPVVAINGACGPAIRKINEILKTDNGAPLVSNYVTSPEGTSFSFDNLVQRLMFVGPYEKSDFHLYASNGLTTDSHSALSFLLFDENGEWSLPNEIKP